MCGSPFCLNPATCTASYSNFPLPPRQPEPDRSQDVSRRTGLLCLCSLLDCCHDERPERNYSPSPGHEHVHMCSGSPQSGYLYPWEPGDESWRDDWSLPFAARPA